MDLVVIAVVPVVAVLFALWAFRKRRHRRRSRMGISQPYSLPGTKHRVVVSYAPPPYALRSGDARSEAEAIDLLLSDEEIHIREAFATAAYWRREHEAIEQAQRALMQPIEQKLRKARRLVAQSGVGGSACDLLKIMWHWPAQSKHEGWPMPAGVARIDGSDAANGKPKWIAWTRNNLRFRLQLDAVSNDSVDGTRLGDLKLSVDDEDVLHLDVTQRVGEEYDQWRALGVSGFRAGPWMMQLNEFAGELRIASSQTMREHALRFYGEKARNIVL
ncbi:MAG TPA: hypothetical protein VGL83_13290 [Stellaceae bacterium]|jgi:hypothetical protein